MNAQSQSPRARAMLRHVARARLRTTHPRSSLDGRRGPPPHQRRHLVAASVPRRARPDKYVAGATPEQMAASKAMRDYYAANFGDWQAEPDETIVGAEEEEKRRREEEEAEEDEESYIVLPPELTRRNIRPLVAYLRDGELETGTRACNRLRRYKVNEPRLPLVPGILHGSDPTHGILSVDRSSKVLVKTPWFEIQRELDRYHYGRTGSFENRVYALTVFPSDECHVDHHRTRHPKDLTTYDVSDDLSELVATPGPRRPTPPPRTPVEGLENVLVLPSDLQMHPVAHWTYCLNYIRYHPKKPIRLPVRTINEEESPTMKRGGFLLFVNKFVECLVEDGAPIPDFIPLECSGLKQKQVVRLERLFLPEGVTIHPRVPKDYLMGTVRGSRGGSTMQLDEETEGEGEGEEEKK